MGSMMKILLQGIIIMEMQSENISDLVKALTVVQAKLQPAKKNERNPFFNSKYADLGSVWEACRELLSSNQLIITHTIEESDTILTETVLDKQGKSFEKKLSSFVVVTTLAHTSGQWMRSRLRLYPVNNTPQAVGSAITYGRRYGLCSIVGIVADEDDDGNAGSGNNGNGRTPPKAPPPKTEQAKGDAPKQGNDWWTSDWKGQTYFITKNEKEMFEHDFLLKTGFKYNDKKKTYSAIFDSNLVDMFEQFAKEPDNGSNK